MYVVRVRKKCRSDGLCFELFDYLLDSGPRADKLDTWDLAVAWSALDGGSCWFVGEGTQVEISQHFEVTQEIYSDDGYRNVGDVECPAAIYGESEAYCGFSLAVRGDGLTISSHQGRHNVFVKKIGRSGGYCACD